MTLNNLSTLLAATYNPSAKHFDKTWKDPNGTTITEDGYEGANQAWGPGIYISIYVSISLLFSICIVWTVLYFMYDGEPMSAFRDEGGD
jgi:hypothetical protein